MNTYTYPGQPDPFDPDELLFLEEELCETDFETDFEFEEAELGEVYRKLRQLIQDGHGHSLHVLRDYSEEAPM